MAELQVLTHWDALTIPNLERVWGEQCYESAEKAGVMEVGACASKAWGCAWRE